MPRRTRPKRRRTYIRAASPKTRTGKRDRYEAMARSLVLRGLASEQILSASSSTGRFIGNLHQTRQTNDTGDQT